MEKKVYLNGYRFCHYGCKKISPYKKCLPWDTSLRGAGSPVKIITLIDLVEDGSLSIEKAAEKAGMTVKQLKELMDKAPLQTV